MNKFWLTNQLRNGLWFIPVTCVLVGALISFITLQIDAHYNYQLVPMSLVGGPDAAIGVLTTVAASMVSLATLVLTITMVVVQLAMGQFSPRIVKTLLKDKPSQIAIGLFVATFAHAMLALRDVQFAGDGHPDQVPGLAIVVAFLLVVISIMVLVIYVDHIGKSLRVASLIELVGNDTRKIIKERFNETALSKPKTKPGNTGFVYSHKSGVVLKVDTASLVAMAEQAKCKLELLPSIGEFVPEDGRLFKIVGKHDRLDHDAVENCVILGIERILDYDVSYGFRMLVDIAERSLADSPFQDPTTTVQAIDRLHDCLRQLATRDFPDGLFKSKDGELRLVVNEMNWDNYVDLAFEEIRLAGEDSPQVTRRLMAALLDLKDIAPAAGQAVLDKHIALLKSAVNKSSRLPQTIEHSLTPDKKGIGS